MDATADHRLDALVASYASGDRIPDHRAKPTLPDDPPVTLELLFEELSAQGRRLEQLTDELAALSGALAALERRVGQIDDTLQSRPYSWWSEHFRGGVPQ
jgi:hypothetical protein